MIKYNLIQKIKNHKFSLREDYQQTVEDLSTLYSKSGIEELTNSFNRLEKEDKRLVGFLYSTSTASEMGAGILCYLGNYESAIFFGILGGLGYIGGMLHHGAMSKR